jgi:hypothetical protein
MEKAEIKPTVVSDHYDFEWASNQVMNDVNGAVGGWALHLSGNHEGTFVTIDDLQTLKLYLDRVIRPALKDAYDHVRRVQGYHFHEKEPK